MFLKTVIPVLWVGDVRKTADYYVSVLGFDEAAFREDPAWGMVEKHDIQLIFSVPPDQTKWQGPAFTGSFFIKTDGVEVWWSYLKERAEVVSSLQDTDYGMREFTIKDCNGYLIQIGEEIET